MSVVLPLIEHYVDPVAHPVWIRTFDAEHRESQMNDDLRASRGVTGILLAVVVMGVTLMAVTVAITLI
jgi:hypothetical protein